MPKIKVELFIAWPPTSLCTQLTGMTRRVAAEFGEQVEINIYQRGQPYPDQPTEGFMKLRKLIRLPAILVDGELLAERELPTEQKLRATIKKKLKK